MMCAELSLYTVEYMSGGFGINGSIEGIRQMKDL